jgi:hypothetical protein
MNKLQSIRRAYEAPIEAALAALTPPVAVLTDNRRYVEDEPDSEWASIRLNFGAMTEESLGSSVDWIRGSLIAEAFVPKGKGPGRGQEIGEAFLDTLKSMNELFAPQPTNVTARTMQLTGPTFALLDKRPHLMIRVTASINARCEIPYSTP